MAETRAIQMVMKSKPALEGAGVHLKRAFGFNEEGMLDPFLLLDDFRSDIPAHYLKGFPWHPHRGIETITYILQGDVEHGDSMGNKGTISTGDVQWMTAGNGIIHQEMPRGDAEGHMYGFQLWANLPQSQKMMDPRYRDVKSSQIPEVALENGVKIRIICGEVAGQRGPVRDIVIEPEYLDITLPENTEYFHPTRPGDTVFAYVIGGKGFFTMQKNLLEEDGTLVLFEDGDQVHVSTGKNPLRFLLISGKPIREPIAWYGPIVMNTVEELELAFDEYRNGTFLKHRQG